MQGFSVSVGKVFLIFFYQYTRNRQIVPFEKTYLMTGKTHSGSEILTDSREGKHWLSIFLQSSQSKYLKFNRKEKNVSDCSLSKM